MHKNKDHRNKGQCTTGPTATTVQSSKQLIKKFWYTVQSIILKSNFGPNWTFWHPWGPGKSFSKGNICTVRSVLLVPNFMQKIKKMCHTVQKIFLKKSILGPKFDPFDSWRAWARVFLRITYTSFEMPYCCLTSCKKSKNSGMQFGSNLWKSPILGQIWPFDPVHWGSRVFIENQKTSLFYSYAVLTLCKISKTSGVQILRYQHYRWTDKQMVEQTEEVEFIGLFQLKPWVQKYRNFLGKYKIFIKSLWIINTRK